MASGSWFLVLVPPSWFVGLERMLLGSVDPWFVRLTGIAIYELAAKGDVSLR